MHHLAAVASPPCASVVDYALRGCDGRHWVWVLLQSPMELEEWIWGYLWIL